MDNQKMISFAMDVAKSLIETKEEIRNIVLFGSVARGDFDEESDIDIFVDIPKVKVSAEKNLRKGLALFHESQLYKNWKLRGIRNDVSLTIGNLKNKEWSSLRRSIISNGILLYGKYIEKPEGLRQFAMFSYEKITNAKKRVTLFRKLFGYTIAGKKYSGLIEKFGGKKLGAGIFMVPIEDSHSILKLLKNMNVSYTIYEIWID